MYSFWLNFDDTDTQTQFSKFLFQNFFESMLINSSFYDKKKNENYFQDQELVFLENEKHKLLRH